ncbi:hypothetical protein GQ600_26577 [Phytophthora cactorum]|nr:hypothetical protein GQ600_26577 [Phytophthora cactorum]
MLELYRRTMMVLLQELNCIMMSQLFDGTEGASGGEPCGIVVLDSVDEDQLYPYVPSERIRKTSPGLSCSQCVNQRDRTTSGGEGKVVTLRRAVFVKLYRPEFEISEAVWQNMQQETTRWGDV